MRVKFEIFAATTFAFVVSLAGCDRRTPEEKGRDYADEKLGFIEGATDELAKRSKDIGSDLGKGVGELVKGTGSAVKDVAHPPVNVTLSPTAQEAGLSVGQANEGEDTTAGREVVVHLKSKREFSGRLTLVAHGDGDSEVHPLSIESVDLPADGASVLRFEFDKSVRLSKMKSFSLQLAEDKDLKLTDKGKDAGVHVSQLRETSTDSGFEVSVYAVFDKKLGKKLSLRAFDGSASEVGRSTLSEPLKQDADSASYVTFPFDARVPMARVKSYELTVVE